MLSNTPLAPTMAGTNTSGGGNMLGQALNTWLQVEQIKAARSTGGGDIVTKQALPEVANGAGIVIDNKQTPSAESVGKFSLSKNVLVLSAALLIGALALRYGRK